MATVKRILISYAYWWIALAVFAFCNDIKHPEYPIGARLLLAVMGLSHLVVAGVFTVMGFILISILNRWGK